MADDKQVTTEEANALREKAAQASVERDVAVEVAMQAADSEDDAIEEAIEQRAEAVSAQASAAQALGREAVAKENARAQHTDALSSQAEAAQMNTLRHAENVRADNEARSGNRARFMLFLMGGITLAVLVVVIMWLSSR